MSLTSEFHIYNSYQRCEKSPAGGPKWCSGYSLAKKLFWETGLFFKPHHPHLIWLEWWFILKGYIFKGYFTVGERIQFLRNE